LGVEDDLQCNVLNFEKITSSVIQ